MSSNQVDASELLQKLLDDRYAVGYVAGKEAGYAAGREAGYAQAMFEIRDAVQARLGGQIEQAGASPEEPAGARLADHPGDENDAEPLDQNPPDLLPNRPALRDALKYVEQHPGVTAHAARGKLKNRNVLYLLARAGFVEKIGPQFFPKNAEAGDVRE